MAREWANPDNTLDGINEHVSINFLKELRVGAKLGC